LWRPWPPMQPNSSITIAHSSNRRANIAGSP
jgi:hypothetical protein